MVRSGWWEWQRAGTKYGRMMREHKSVRVTRGEVVPAEGVSGRRFRVRSDHCAMVRKKLKEGNHCGCNGESRYKPKLADVRE